MARTTVIKVAAGLAVVLVAAISGVLIYRYAHQYHGRTHFPKQTWAAAGSADPVSALETACFANAHSDGKAMLASLGPGLQAEVKKNWAKHAQAQGVSQEDYFASLTRKPMSFVVGFRVLGEDFVNSDEVLLKIYVQGWWEKVTLKMKRINQEWKVTGVQWG